MSIQSDKRHIFISYSRKDKDFATELSEKLKEAGNLVWFDTSDIKPGDPWKERIVSAMENSTCVCFCISDDSIKSQYVKFELELACENNIRIVPLCLSMSASEAGTKLGKKSAVFKCVGALDIVEFRSGKLEVAGLRNIQKAINDDDNLYNITRCIRYDAEKWNGWKNGDKNKYLYDEFLIDLVPEGIRGFGIIKMFIEESEKLERKFREEQRKHFDITNELIKVMRQESQNSIDRKAFYHLILEAAMLIGGAESGIIRLVIEKEGSRYLKCEAEIDVPDDKARLNIPISNNTPRNERGIVGWVAENSKPLRANNVKHPFLQEIYINNNPKTKSLLAVPIKAGKKAIGVINVESYKRDNFTHEHRNLLMQLSRYVTIANAVTIFRVSNNE